MTREHQAVEAETIVGALAPSLAAAGNFLAGVRARADALAAQDTVVDEAVAQLAYGLDSAVIQIQRAAAVLAALHTAPAKESPC